MTIIIDTGEWWIDKLLVPITIDDPSNFYNSAVINIVRGGKVMGVSTSIQNMPNSTGSRNMGGCMTLTGAGAPITLGLEITTILCQIQKVASLAGVETVTLEVLLIMKK